MAFIQKTWKDRVAEFINRRTLTKEDGATELVTVERSEGTISQEGDAFSAANMNDLEQRIADEFDELNSKIPFALGVDADGNYGYKKAGADTVIPFNDTSGATAVASQITEGCTAWVNGELITGTRPAPITSLSGSFTYSLGSTAQTTQLVSFATPFDSIPTVTVVTHNEPSVVVTVSNITRSSCVITVKNTTGDGYYNKTCNWSAEAK